MFLVGGLGEARLAGSQLDQACAIALGRHVRVMLKGTIRQFVQDDDGPVLALITRANPRP